LTVICLGLAGFIVTFGCFGMKKITDFMQLFRVGISSNNAEYQVQNEMR
jgi:hypothetical protein